MYATQLPAKACVRLLNATGPVGCAAPAGTLSTGQLSLAEDWREGPAGLPIKPVLLQGPLSCFLALLGIYFDTAFAGQTVVVVPLDDLADFLTDQQHDASNASSIAAMIVTPGGCMPRSAMPKHEAHAFFRSMLACFWKVLTPTPWP